MPKRTKPHRDMMVKFLRDRRAASEYLNAAIEEGDSVFCRPRSGRRARPSDV
jgi:DNA-binding phage protein